MSDKQNKNQQTIDSLMEQCDSSFDGRLEIRNPKIFQKLIFSSSARELHLNFDGEISEYSLREQLTSEVFHSLTKITVSPVNKFYKSINDILYTKDGKTLIFCPVAKDGELHIPEGTEYIGAYAFFRNRGISKLYFPDSLKYIGNQAFFGMKNLEAVNFGNGLKKIGGTSSESIFEGCKQLTEINVPKQIGPDGQDSYKGISLKY